MEYDFLDAMFVAYFLKRFMSLVQKVELSESSKIKYYYFVLDDNCKFMVSDIEIDSINKYLSIIDLRIKLENDKLIIEDK